MGSLSQSLFVPLILLNQSVDYTLQMYFSNRLVVWLDLLYALRVAGALKGWCAVRTLPTSVLYKVKTMSANVSLKTEFFRKTRFLLSHFVEDGIP